jgi:prepilin-type N-terminal cleavage/methylation domain-containing protein
VLGRLGTRSGAPPRLGLFRRARGQAGVSLIEVLITVVLMGTAMVAFCSGMFMMVKTSQVTQTKARLEGELRKLSEAVRVSTYQECPGVLDTAYPAPATLYSVPAWTNAPTTKVWHWNGSPPVNGVYNFVDNCPAGADTGVQKIQLTVTAKDGLKESIDIIKRKP